MSKLIPPNHGIRGVDVQTTRGTKKVNIGKDGLLSVNNPKTIKALKKEGFVEANLSSYSIGDQDRGYNCTACGFGSWFKKCGRCGHDNDRLETDSSNG